MPNDLLELPCPACGGLNPLSEELLPASGEIACAFCGEGISVRPAARTTGVQRAPMSHRPPPMPERATSILDPWEQWEASEAEAAQVRCPSCGHRFDPAAAERRATVLVVEDTEFFLQLATDVLRRHYRIVIARSAAEARQALATEPVELVVLDLTLPDAEGTEVMRALPRPNIPVLVYTSRDETSLLGAEWRLLETLGARDVVHKGIHIEDLLLRKVNELLAGAAATR
jgi:CheY-like chemotaxis protein